MSIKKKTEQTEEATEVTETETTYSDTENKEVSTVKSKEAVTYLGPTIKNVVEKGTVFSGGILTTIFEEKLKERPMLKSLLIPTSGLVKAKKELGNKESALSAIYRKEAEEEAKNE